MVWYDSYFCCQRKAPLWLTGAIIFMTKETMHISSRFLPSFLHPFLHKTTPDPNSEYREATVGCIQVRSHSFQDTTFLYALQRSFHSFHTPPSVDYIPFTPLTLSAVEYTHSSTHSSLVHPRSNHSTPRITLQKLHSPTSFNTTCTPHIPPTPQAIHTTSNLSYKKRYATFHLLHWPLLPTPRKTLHPLQTL